MKGVLLNELRFSAYFHRRIAVHSPLVSLSSHFHWFLERGELNQVKGGQEEATKNQEDTYYKRSIIE